MLRSRFEFAYVLLIFINDFYLVHLYTLRCNNTVDSSTEWIPWEYEQCLMLIDSDLTDLSFDEAKQSCSTYQRNIFEIHHQFEFDRFQQRFDEIDRRVPIWVSLTNQSAVDTASWCSTNEQDDDLSCETCVALQQRLTSASLCLNRRCCTNKFAYICQELTQDDQSRIFNLVGDLIGGLFGGGAKPPQTQATAPPPQIIYQTRPPPPEIILPQKSKSDDTMLYIILGVGGVLLVGAILVCCFCFGGVLLWKSQSSTPPPRPRSSRHPRTSTDSAASDGTS